MRLICEPTETVPPVSGISWLNPSCSVDWFCDWPMNCGRAVGLRDRVDAVVEVRGVAAEEELRQQSRVERVVARPRAASRVLRATCAAGPAAAPCAMASCSVSGWWRRAACLGARSADGHAARRAGRRREIRMG